MIEYKDWIYVIDKDKQPCNPINNAKARFLLNNSKAVIVNHEPLVIQRIDNYSRQYEVDKKYVIKIDSGYKYIGFSVTNDHEEVICGQVKMLEGMSDRLSERARNRKARRSRLRHRRNKNVDKKTVNNPTNKNGNEDGWFAPSIQHKIDTHERLVDLLSSWIPIDHIELEIANFDIQQMKADLMGYEMNGVDYQNGEMKGYDNVKLYVKERDKYTCQNNNCKKQTTSGEVHHIVPRKDGGSNRPGNLIYLCKECHTKCHRNNNNNDLFRELQKKRKNDDFKEATFMNVVRYAIYNSIGKKYDVDAYFGYVTNKNRNAANLPKFHHNDAVCINSFSNSILSKSLYLVEQVRCNDRSMKDFSDAQYIDSRAGAVKKGSELNKIHKDGSSKRSTRKEDIENLRVFRERKIKSGTERYYCHNYCLKKGDLIQIKGKNIICEVFTMQSIKKEKDGTQEISAYKIYYINDDPNNNIKRPSISIKPNEYNKLKETGECDKIKIIRTRRGMVWRQTDRVEFENKFVDQYHIK